MSVQSIPSFAQEVVNDYQSGVSHSFLLHGGVGDYVDHPERNIPCPEYLAFLFGGRFVVAGYANDLGITFPNDTTDGRDRKAFLKATGYKSESGGGGMAALLRGQVAQAQTATSANDDVELPSAPSAALPLLLRFLAAAPESVEGVESRRHCVLVERLDLILPRQGKDVLPEPRAALLGALCRFGTDARVERTGGILIALAPSPEDVNVDLLDASSGLRVIEVPAPDYEERLAFIRRTVEANEVTAEMSLEELAAMSAGQSRRGIEDVALRAIARDGVVTYDLARERKAEQISAEYEDVIRIVTPGHKLDAVGGHAEAKSYLRKRVVRALREPRFRDKAPTGIVFMGPAGTGKTFIAEALAGEVGWNDVEMDIGKLRGGIVGETDRKVAKAFRALEILAPCIVFIDELDQAFRRGEGGSDSGGGGAAENSLFAAMLKFFGNPKHRGRILAIAATNRPDVIDAAMMRPGRFELQIPLLPPDESDRRDALRTLLAKYGYDAEGVSFEPLVERTEGFTVAELDRVVREADALVAFDELGLQDALETALRKLRAATKDVALHTDVALAACADSDLVPSRYKERVGRASEAAVKAGLAEERATRTRKDSVI